MNNLIDTVTILSKINKKPLGKLEFYSNNESKYLLKGFTGRRKTADFFFRYKTLVDMMLKVEQFSDSLHSWDNRKLEAGERHKKDVKEFKAKLEVGTILSASWGYNQTNVDFYKVTWINESKSKVKIRELYNCIVEGSECHMNCKVVAGAIKDDRKELEKSVRSSYIKINSNVSLRIWDKKPTYCSWYA